METCTINASNITILSISGSSDEHWCGFSG